MNPDVLDEEGGTQAELSYEEEWAAQWGVPEQDDKGTQDEQEELELEDGDADQETEVEEVAATPVAAPDDPYSWIAALPDAVKEQAERLKHSALSDKGRVSAYNRELETLRRELEAAKNSTRAPVPATQSPSVSAAPELSAKFKQLKEDFPEFAEAVEELRELDRVQIESRITAALSPVTQITAQKARDDFERQVTASAEEIFRTTETGWDWKEIVVGEDFLAWLKLQPSSVRAAAALPDATEAIAILSRYEQDYEAAIALTEPTANSPALKADEVRKTRNQRKASSVTPGSRPVAIDPKNQSGDYDSQFNAMWG